MTYQVVTDFEHQKRLGVEGKAPTFQSSHPTIQSSSHPAIQSSSRPTVQPSST
jgi:hypothetical protein